MEKIRRMPGVRRAEFLKPDSTNADIRRMVIIALDAAGRCEELAHQVSSLAAVESATVPTRRQPTGD